MSKTRCAWVNLKNPDYIDYHDHEWGIPILDDKTLFEFMVLESSQAGLSWEIILTKRNGYKKAFANFNPKEVATFTNEHVEVLMQNIDIVRNRLKIKATINNAQQFLKICHEYGNFSKYLWKFVGGKQLVNDWQTIRDVPTHTDTSIELAKDLKIKGFKFLGPTTCYAYMQAVGMVYDHTSNCFKYKKHK
ncbi:MAG: DNA-3-methyladenine glycosylase I [Candidatus Pacebacteria bacterium]|nr:DNA-3-methyladenine glycosylase I [Candidatus Paceibacterota bacterium]MCF7857030.1 DNA-3-methyladenine glycosylase I [Candidatus Paceibacterota bacterium]